MKFDKQINLIANRILEQIDALGYQLDSIGVENQINRHSLIATLMFSQKRVEGELDSLSARYESGKARTEAVIDATEKYVASGFNLAVFPAKYAYERIRSRI